MNFNKNQLYIGGQAVTPRKNADGSVSFLNSGGDVVTIMTSGDDGNTAGLLPANKMLANSIETMQIVGKTRAMDNDIVFIDKSQGTGNGLQQQKQTWKLMVAANSSGATKNIIIGDFGGFIQALLGVQYVVTDYPQTWTFSPLSFFGAQSASSLLTAAFGTAPVLSNLFKNARVNHVKVINTAAPQTPVGNAVSWFWAGLDYTQMETGLSLKKSLLFPSNPVDKDSFNASVYDTTGLDLIVGQVGAFVLQIPNGTPAFEFDMDVVQIDSVAMFAQNVSI